MNSLELLGLMHTRAPQHRWVPTREPLHRRSHQPTAGEWAGIQAAVRTPGKSRARAPTGRNPARRVGYLWAGTVSKTVRTPLVPLRA